MTFFYVAIGLMAFVVTIVLFVSVALAVYLTVGFCVLLASLIRALTHPNKEI